MNIVLGLVGGLLILALAAALVEWLVFKKPSTRRNTESSPTEGETLGPPPRGDLFSNPERFLPPTESGSPSGSQSTLQEEKSSGP